MEEFKDEVIHTSTAQLFRALFAHSTHPAFLLEMLPFQQPEEDFPNRKSDRNNG
jgi:hypothetical protein